MPRHVNIPIFIPHLGCPNACVFCNQRYISGVHSFDISSVRVIIEDSLKTINSPEDEVEIAFFGGSFTGIDQGLMISLLEIAKEYIDNGRVSCIRCSTRPDYITPEVLTLLKKYSVKTIELGIQSVCNSVLDSSKRGHSFLDSYNAAKLVVSYGFELVGQMMIGLPSSSSSDEIATARFICECGAKGARVYPTVVFNETELMDMTKKGNYLPLSLDEAIDRCAAVCKVFNENGVKIIRVGLCSSENLSSDTTYYAGPNHPAIGELVENKIFYDNIKDQIIAKNLKGKNIKVFIPKGALSKALGHKKQNKIKLTEEFSLTGIHFTESVKIAENDALVVEEGNT